jgi:hypothetical protein
MNERVSTIGLSIRDNRQSVILHPYSEDFAAEGKKILPGYLQIVYLIVN